MASKQKPETRHIAGVRIEKEDVIGLKQKTHGYVQSTSLSHNNC